LSVSRREFTVGAAAVVLSASLPLAPFSALAQGRPTKKFAVTELYKPGPLGDNVLGKEDAPVTVVEYASFTCSHCANFHTTTFPKLKEKYIDTGKVKFIFRPFPTGPAQLSIAAGMLAQCVGKEKYFPMASALMETQRNWMMANDPLPLLRKLGNQAGLSNDQIDKCLSDQTLAAEIQQSGVRGYQSFGVEGTPTFFVNGTIVVDGDVSFEDFSKVLDPLIK